MVDNRQWFMTLRLPHYGFCMSMYFCLSGFFIMVFVCLWFIVLFLSMSMFFGMSMTIPNPILNPIPIHHKPPTSSFPLFRGPVADHRSQHPVTNPAVFTGTSRHDDSCSPNTKQHVTAQNLIDDMNLCIYIYVERDIYIYIYDYIFRYGLESQVT